ncbi:mediator of RNA polymerase II transcription subunit 15a-like [Oryza glaberrima]|uniref:Uncharacterized protein n=1 Tax=Oryza glaberrima TaxID=4538 RepID=I1PIT6_ORYGL|nr:mediator of RNA polymerase II transcription subunit 15a-like [Oryza glaberrima]AHW98602.1 hypothetical protein [Oryza glaberrima]
MEGAAAAHPAASSVSAAAHWMATEDPGLRSNIINNMVKKFMTITNSQHDHHYREIQNYAVRCEQDALNRTTNKEDYLRNIAQRILNMEMKVRRSQSLQAGTTPSAQRPSSQQQNVCIMPQNPGQVPDQHRASAPNSQIEASQEQTVMVAAPDRYLNFNTTAISPVAMHVHPSQQPQSQQHQQQAKQLHPTNVVGYNPTSLNQIQGQSVSGQNFQQNPVLGQNASGSGTQQRQLAETPEQHQLLRMKQQHMRGNQQQNFTQRNQILPAQQAHLGKMQIGHPGVQNNQQNVGVLCQPMTPPQCQVATAQQSSLGCHSPQTSEPMVIAGEVDWREEIFQKIKSFKDAFLSEVLEYNRMVQVPKLTEEQLRSLPVENAEKLRCIRQVKKIIAMMLDLLNTQKSNVHKGMQNIFPIFQQYLGQLRLSISKSKARNTVAKTGCQSQNCSENSQIVNLAGNTAPFTCDASRQQKQQEQVTNAKTSRMEQTIMTRTPTPQQESHGCHLLGVPSPCFSPEALQPSSTNTVEECFTPFPVTKTVQPVKVASPHVASLSASVKSSVPKPGVARVVSPSASEKSRLASSPSRPEGAHAASPSSTSVESTLPTPIAKPGTVRAASPCTPVKSTSQSPVTKPGVAEVDSRRACVTSKLKSPVGKPETTGAASPCASVKSKVSLDVDSVTEFLQHRVVAPAAANGSSNQAIPSLVSAAPPKAAHQAEDQVHDEAEKIEAKRPISRLIETLLSSSPEALRHSANSMRLAIWEADRIPAPSPLPYRPRNGKMKRDFDHVTSRPVSSPLSSTDESCMTSECAAFEDESSGEYTAKRQKTQVNANDALVHEIKTINNKLVDTVISIADENGTDEIIYQNGGGTLIKLSYNAISLSPSLKSLFAASEMTIVMPVKLLVPADYPKSSPILVDNDDEQRRLSDISHAVAMAFGRAVGELPEPRSIEATAMAWDGCVRRAVTEVAHRHGGGTFSSRRNQWRAVQLHGPMVSL